MFRVYFTWANRKSQTHKDFETIEECEAHINSKFKNRNCFCATIENIEFCKAIKTLYNQNV